MMLMKIPEARKNHVRHEFDEHNVSNVGRLRTIATPLLEAAHAEAVKQEKDYWEVPFGDFSISMLDKYGLEMSTDDKSTEGTIQIDLQTNNESIDTGDYDNPSIDREGYPLVTSSIVLIGTDGTYKGQIYNSQTGYKEMHGIALANFLATMADQLENTKRAEDIGQTALAA